MLWKLQGVVENEKHTKSTLECTQVTTQQRDHQTYKSSSIVDNGWLRKYIKHDISWEILKTYLFILITNLPCFIGSYTFCVKFSFNKFVQESYKFCVMVNMDDICMY